jgi:hypothetical protein
VNAAEGRAVVMHRALGQCEVGVAPGCIPSQPEWHHRKLRSRGVDHGPANGLAACRPCHRWIHLNVAEAAGYGWVLPSTCTKPSAVPALVRRRGVDPPAPVTLTAGGTYG